MEQIIKVIQNVFTQFDNFNFVIDTERKKVLDFDFEEMNLLFYDDVKKIEQLLQSIYLQGNDKTLQRVKLELLRIENTLKNIDFGIVIQYPKYSFNITIEPEIVTKINLLKLSYVKKIITFIENILPPQQTETKSEQGTIEMKPVLKPEVIETVFDILKDFFSTEQQNELKQLLKTGTKKCKHLIFLDNGNRLADAFKQLKKADLITQCGQKELELWISKNFNYTHRKQIKEFTARYLNDIISTNADKCQKPLLNVKKDKATGEINITKA